MIAIYLSTIEDELQKNKFEELYYKYRYLMYYVAQGVLNDKSDAEDAVQEAFFRIAKNMDKIGNVDDKETKNFVSLIAKREALRILEKDKKYIATDDVTLEKLGEHRSQDVVNNVVEAIKRLPKEYEVLMSLKYVFGYSGKEISEVTGITEVNVRQKLYKGKKMLEKLL